MKIKTYLGLLLRVILVFSIVGCEDDDAGLPARIEIIQPEDNSSFPFGTMIEFQVSAWGNEHGAFYHVFGFWTISRHQTPDRMIFSKEFLHPWETDTLSVGTYIVTATLNDGGLSDSVTITITPN